MVQTLPDSPNVAANCHYDLVIVGGGIVGLTLAAALSPVGFKVAIVEAKPFAQAATQRRAYAMSLLSGRIFESIGIWQEIITESGKFQQIRLSDGDDQSVVKFQTQELGTEYLGYVSEHGTILKALHQYLVKLPNIDWFNPAEVIDVSEKASGVEITVQAEAKQYQLQSQLVIGADGARSRLRQWAGIQTRGWKYWQSCVAFTIKHSASRNDIAFERFWHTGPMGVLPLPGNRCQIVWTAPHAQAKRLESIDESTFLSELMERTGGLLGDLTLESDRTLFPVQLMQSDRYVKSRLALVGDAAHCCHPVGGQGLNLGIRDAASLAQILAEAKSQGEDIGSLTVLKRYERWRKRENLAILGFTDILDRLFSNNFFPLVIIRRFGLWLLKYLTPLKVFSLKLMVGFLGRKPRLSWETLVRSS